MAVLVYQLTFCTVVEAEGITVIVLGMLILRSLVTCVNDLEILGSLLLATIASTGL